MMIRESVIAGRQINISGENTREKVKKKRTDKDWPLHHAVAWFV